MLTLYICMKGNCFSNKGRGLKAKRSYSSMSVANSGNRLLPNSYWIAPGRFAAGEFPGAKDPAEAARKLRTLFSAGIDHFIDLTEPGELVPYVEIAKEEARCLDTAVGYERHPVIDQCVPSSPGQMTRILDAIDAAICDGKTVYLHCWGGVGRTGTVVGCWLVRHGRTGDAALRQIAAWWKGVEKVYRKPISPETSEQHEYVRDWTEPSPEVVTT